MNPLRVLISGGGTGGHIFPAIAIANEIKKNEPNAEFLFVGANGRMEMEKVPAAGYQIKGLDISGFQRRLTFSNFLFPFRLIISVIKARRIVKEFKPDIAIGTGGYASGPALNAANSQGIPCIIQEQNSYPGITNKLLSKKAKYICVAYEGMNKFFPSEKIVLTGNPIRQDIYNVQEKRNEGLNYFKLDSNKKTILIIGGSLGAKTINESIANGVEKFKDNNIQIIWQTGKSYFDVAKEITKNLTEFNIFSFDFISRMDLAYSVADIVISRAGASSISELCAVQIPSILVPSPNVAEDHQTKNAMALANTNAALVVKDSEAIYKLTELAIELIKNNDKQNELKKNISGLAKYDSAKKIAELAIKIAKENKQ
ncbi:MAG: undecaprenyldiphospho-muramoylpentapeptide beta-N-acetylglucosaminyltransferase [Bacteroidota bacterium]